MRFGTKKILIVVNPFFNLYGVMKRQLSKHPYVNKTEFLSKGTKWVMVLNLFDLIFQLFSFQMEI